MCIIGLSVMAQLVGSRHLQTKPAPRGRSAPQPPTTRCEATLRSRTDAKTHREWYRTHSKEGGGCQEQEESADMQTRYNVKLKAHGLYDPQLHRPQQKVSILDGLVGEEASMIVMRRRPLATRDNSRIGPDISFTSSQDSVIVM